MKRLKKWLETGLIAVIVIVVGVFIVLPICLVALFLNFAFIGARYINNAMAAITAVATVSYFGHLARNGEDFGVYGWAALIIMVAMLVMVAVWDVAAWALWRWRPDWLDAILPDDDPTPPPLPKKLENWLGKLGQKVSIVIDVILVSIFAVAIIALPFVLGMEGLTAVLDFTLFFVLLLTAGALAWPVMVLMGWLPRCRKRKFDEFFCAATRNCEVIIFGKALKDDQEPDGETTEERQSDQEANADD